ncbi:MAG TPA: DUF1059 domain-containing protein [Acidimicrobiia bacterium]|nr:DUF1059 domain-containing protein [Acidimicrobiia bacterium]
MFKFVCDHIVPGCTHEDQDESRDKLMDRVAIHLREHHDIDHTHDHVAEALRSTGIMVVRGPV